MAVFETQHDVDGAPISIFVELDQDSESGRTGTRGRGDAGRKAIETSKDLFGAALQLIDDCARSTVQGIRNMGADSRPDEFELQFMIKLDTEVGAVIAKAQTGAQLQVTLTWKQETQTK